MTQQGLAIAAAGFAASYFPVQDVVSVAAAGALCVIVPWFLRLNPTTTVDEVAAVAELVAVD